MIPDSVYKTHFHVIIRHVQISTWTLIPLIVCLTSLITIRLPIFRNLPKITIVINNSRSILNFTLDLYAHLFGLRSVPDNFRTPGSLLTHPEFLGTIGTHSKYSDTSSGYSGAVHEMKTTSDPPLGSG